MAAAPKPEIVSVTPPVSGAIALPPKSMPVLLLFDFLLVKDASKLIQRVRRIAAQGRDVLRGILTNLNRSPCYSRTGRVIRITLGRHGNAGGEAYGVVDLVFLLSAHLVIAAVVVILGAYAFRAVVRTVPQIAERERPCREAVLSRIRFACNDGALEVGVLFDVDVEAAFSSEDTRLASGIAMITMSFPADRDVTASAKLLLYIIFIPDFSKPLISDILCTFRF